MAGSVILTGARTPIGKLSGSLAGFQATELGGIAIKAALERAGLSPEQVDRLREEFGVYLIRSGRMCVAGLNSRNVEATAEAFARVM